MKFANTGIKTGMDNCKDFVKVASPILPIKVIPLPDNVEASQSQFVEDSQIHSTPPSQATQEVQETSLDGESSLLKEGSSLPDIARQVLNNEQLILGCYTPESQSQKIVEIQKVSNQTVISHNFPLKYDEFSVIL